MTDDEMADALRAKGWRVSRPLTPETCRHPNMRGGGWLGGGGGRLYGHCPDCGYSYDYMTPPIQTGLTSILQN